MDVKGSLFEGLPPPARPLPAAEPAPASEASPAPAPAIRVTSVLSSKRPKEKVDAAGNVLIYRCVNLLSGFFVLLLFLSLLRLSQLELVPSLVFQV